MRQDVEKLKKNNDFANTVFVTYETLLGIAGAFTTLTMIHIIGMNQIWNYYVNVATRLNMPVGRIFRL